MAVRKVRISLLPDAHPNVVELFKSLREAQAQQLFAIHCMYEGRRREPEVTDADIASLKRGYGGAESGDGAKLYDLHIRLDGERHPDLIHLWDGLPRRWRQVCGGLFVAKGAQALMDEAPQKGADHFLMRALNDAFRRGGVMDLSLLRSADADEGEPRGRVEDTPALVKGSDGEGDGETSHQPGGFTDMDGEDLDGPVDDDAGEAGARNIHEAISKMDEGLPGSEES